MDRTVTAPAVLSETVEGSLRVEIGAPGMRCSELIERPIQSDRDIDSSILIFFAFEHILIRTGWSFQCPDNLRILDWSSSCLLCICLRGAL